MMIIIAIAICQCWLLEQLDIQLELAINKVAT